MKTKTKEVSNLELAFGNFKMFLAKLIREVLKSIWKAIKKVLKKIWKFLMIRVDIRKYPRVFNFLMYSFLGVNAVAWIIVPTYLGMMRPSKIYIYERTGVSVSEEALSPLPVTEAFDSTSGTEGINFPSASEDISIEEIVGKIHMLESSGGKNNYSKCEAINKFNGSGFGISGNGKYLCFNSPDEEKIAVGNWFKDKLEQHDLNTAICGYNLGFNSEHLQECLDQSDKYPYLKNYKSI